MEKLAAYIPMDWRQALSLKVDLSGRTHGAALFADISGFTPLTEGLARVLGPQRGAEELASYINRVYDALIAELHRYGGSVISFAGDSITCWLEGDDGRRATACALAMQQAMSQFETVTAPGDMTVSLAVKTAVAVGSARRFLVGDPQMQIIDVLAGSLLDELIEAEHHANKGEVVLAPSATKALSGQIIVSAVRNTDEREFAVINALSLHVAANPWPSLLDETFTDEDVRPWLLPPVYERLRSGQGEFLAELRPAVALFMRFEGIHYDDDPDAPKKLDDFIRQVQNIIAQYEGSLLQLTIGDKGSYLYAAFGAPIAHEDDALRAATAAMALRDLAVSLEYITVIQQGIAAGRMRTGAYGGGMRRTYGAIGDAVNLAARLMQSAASGQILVGSTVYNGLKNEFDWQQLPSIAVKGKTEKVEVAALIRPHKQTTANLQGSRYAVPMVGREGELGILQQKLSLAWQGKGQIVAITGEAGIGKSRLVAEVMRVTAVQETMSFGGACQSYAMNTGYFVWQQIWHKFFKLQNNWSVERQLSQLAITLKEIDPGFLPRLPLLGPVLNLPIPDNELTRSFDAALRKMSLESLLVDCLRSRACEEPMLFVLEDCHWLDPLSHDLLEVLGRAIVDLPVVFLLSYRPVTIQRLQEPRVSQLPYTSEIQLTEFSPEEAKQLIELKLHQFYGPMAEIPQDVVENITVRSEGNPFYIEELVNYLQDRKIPIDALRSLEVLDLPTSLHSLILSRIDQLTESQKGVIKVASVIGRIFPAAMLWGAYPQLGNVERIKQDLHVLSQLDLTPQDAPEPELTYLFKNIITQEVAYENLPFSMRASLHEAIGFYLEETYQNGLDRVVNLLAFHFERSRNEAKKCKYLLRAGELAQASYANEAAIEYYRRAIPLLPAEERVPVMLKLGDVLQLVGQWPEAEELYGEALTLARQLGDLAGRAWSQTAIAEHMRKQGKYEEAAVHLLRAQSNFEELEDKAGVGQVLHNAGTLAAQRGDYEAAWNLWQESLAIRRTLNDEQNIGSLLSNMGIVARYQEDYELAQQLYEESLAMRRRLGDRWAIAVSLNNLGLLALHVGDLQTARQRLEETVELQREVGGRWYLANALHDLANVTREEGDYPAARSLYQESLRMNQILGDKRAVAYLLEDICVLDLAENDPMRALTLCAAATELRQNIGALLPPTDLEKLQDRMERAVQMVGEEQRMKARQQGMGMTLQDAVSYALGR
ncbi:MAG: tetratricopeptide repeat protein [Ardenticatenaceae bacterium]|nr:tetratricopeptide repeat protein [Anaerolineales bacterium]MCB8921790.1 tetratricopeptide repeat protein [Ardenticatenaceae bacterium]